MSLPTLPSVEKLQRALHTKAKESPSFRFYALYDKVLRGFLDEIEFNPKRLDEVEERLDLIHSLTRKYGGSIPAVIAYGNESRKQLELITTASERIDELEMQEAKLLEKLAKQGSLLSEKRRSAAVEMGNGIEAELDDLRMEAAKFGVDFQTKPDPNGAPVENGTRIAFDQNGFDRVEFLIAPNPGEGLKPLAKIASGGETSRLMLGLKNVLARADEVPSLIFVEIDQGIGGRVGMVVGQKLWNPIHRFQRPTGAGAHNGPSAPIWPAGQPPEGNSRLFNRHARLMVRGLSTAVLESCSEDVEHRRRDAASFEANSKMASGIPIESPVQMVFGASGGIGSEVCRRLAAAGTTVA